MFSNTEEIVLVILGKKTMKISEIAESSNIIAKAFNPNAVVSSAILRINRKCKYHKLPWFINGMGGGRGGRTVWRDKL